jgi:hypothetical protein
VFGTLLLGKIFGPEMEGVTEKQRKLHNDELDNSHSSTNKYNDERNEDNVYYSKPSIRTTILLSVFSSYCNMFRPAWPSSGNIKKYKTLSRLSSIK